jgi:hypothetical protein
MKAPVFKIQTITFQRIGKILLWTLVLFLILRGIGSLFKEDQTEAVKQVINDFISSRKYKEKVEFEATAFAKAFAIEYITYDGSNPDDYKNRLKQYAPGYLDNFGIIVRAGMKAQGIGAEALRLDWKSKNQLNIDVKVKVMYTHKIQTDGMNFGEPGPTETVSISDTYLRIPVVEKEGKYLVEDYPAFIAGPDKADVDFNYFSGKEVDLNLSKEVVGVLQNFFKTYYGGNSSEISYYMLDSKNQIKGLGGRYELSEINNVNVYNTDKENQYFALVTLTIKDSVNKQDIPQRFHVNVIQKDGRFYIENFDVRIGNIHIE